jgi:hypothetical protein
MTVGQGLQQVRGFSVTDGLPHRSRCRGQVGWSNNSICFGAESQLISCSSSRGEVQSVAPSRMRAWHPAELTWVMGPGTAKTALP